MEPSSRIAVIIPAAGASRRFQGDVDDPLRPKKSKIETVLAGRPVFLRSVELFIKRPSVVQIILAVNPDSIDEFCFKHGDKLGFHGVDIIAGGRAGRWETVLQAIKSVQSDCSHIAVHDAARPLTCARLIDELFEASRRFAAVVPGLPINATVKRVADDEADGSGDSDPLDAILGPVPEGESVLRHVVETVNRDDLVEVQTPQIFEANLLRRAYAQVADGKVNADSITDDAGLVELLGESVHVVEGHTANFKITGRQDLQLAEAVAVSVEQKKVDSLDAKRLFASDDD